MRYIASSLLGQMYILLELQTVLSECRDVHPADPPDHKYPDERCNGDIGGCLSWASPACVGDYSRADRYTIF